MSRWFSAILAALALVLAPTITLAQQKQLPVGATPGTPLPVPTTLDAVYCNTVGRQIVRTTGAWTCAQGIPADPTWWGADPTGAADSAAALSAAYQAARYVRFPPGKYRFSSAGKIAIAGPLGSARIEGSGADNTIFHFPSTAGWTFQLSSQGQSVHLADFSITTGAANAGSAITIQNMAPFRGTFSAQSDVTRVTCRGDDGYAAKFYWSTCFNIVAATGVSFEGLNIYGDSTALHGTGISFSAPSERPSTNCLSSSPVCGTTYLISKSNFSFLGTGILVGSNIQSISIDTSFIAQVENGVAISANARTLQGLNITNLHCFAYRRCLLARSSQPNLQVVGGYMNVAEGGNYAIDVPSSQMTITGVTFFPRTVPNPANSGAIALRAASESCGINGIADCAGPAVINNNSYTSIGTAVLIDSAVGMVNIGPGNAYNNLAHSVIDKGTGNRVGALIATDTGSVGYSVGAGGSFRQTTSKSSRVTLNYRTGRITTNDAALAAGEEVAFLLFNNKIGAHDIILPQVGNGNYAVRATDRSAGQVTIRLKNLTNSSQSDAVTIDYVVISGATS